MAEEIESPIADALSYRVSGLINEILAEQGGGMMEGFVIWVNFLDKGGEPSFAFSIPPEQRMTETAGMISMLNAQHRVQVEEYLRD